MNTENNKFLLTEKDFNTIVFLIYSNVGISLRKNKKNLVYNRLVNRLRKKKLNSFEEYIKLLNDKSSPEWDTFVNALTTNLTSFFRESYHFDLLAEHVKKNLLTKSKVEPLKIWCSACSTGEEAYSVAMTMIDLFGTMAPPIKILATDLNTEVLSTAKKGIYSAQHLEKLSDIQKNKFFQKSNSNDFFEVKPEVKALISFKRLNLIDPKWPMTKTFDVIFCRNVMIYFDKETQRKLLVKFANYLPQGALLFLGHSENFSNEQQEFKLIRQTMYKRV